MHGQRSYQGYYGLNWTTTRTLTGETPFKLAFGTEVVIPVEVEVFSLRRAHYDKGSNNEELRLNLDCLPEVRDKVALRMAQYQQKMVKYHNQMVKLRRFNPMIWYCEKSQKPLGTQHRGS